VPEPGTLKNTDNMKKDAINDEAMIDKIWDTITDSAKRRFDYAALEEGLTIAADNFLFGIIMGLAIGEAKNIIALKLMNQLMMVGLMVKKDDILKTIEELDKDCGLEVLATRMANDTLENGGDPFATYVTINQFLN
jgi:galactitol-specific phosphotransferase system IIC component